MLKGLGWYKIIFSRSERLASQTIPESIPEAVPEYIPSIPAPMNTPVSPVRIGGNSYSLSGPTRFIAQAFRSRQPISYLSIQRRLADISLSISQNRFLVAASPEETLIYGDRLYGLQRGFYTLYSRSQRGFLSALSESSLDNLLHFERKAEWLHHRLQKVEAWESSIYLRNPKTAYLIRRNCLEGLLRHGEQLLCELEVRRRRLPLPFFSKAIPKREFFLPLQRVIGQAGGYLRESGEVVKDQFALGLQEIRAHPIFIGLAIVTTVLLVGAVTYWASERNSFNSFYDH